MEATTENHKPKHEIVTRDVKSEYPTHASLTPLVRLNTKGPCS